MHFSLVDYVFRSNISAFESTEVVLTGRRLYLALELMYLLMCLHARSKALCSMIQFVDWGMTCFATVAWKCSVAPRLSHFARWEMFAHLAIRRFVFRLRCQTSQHRYIVIKTRKRV